MDRERTWTAEEILSRAANRLAERKEDAVSPDEPGITPRTFRYHRTLGLISPPFPRRGKKAVFGEQHLDEVVAVHRLKNANWDLRRIRLALDAAREDPRLLAALAVHGRHGLTPDLLDSLEARVSHRLSREGEATRTVSKSESPVVSSVCLAPGIYLVVDRNHSGRLEQKEAYRVGERAAAWLADEKEETHHKGSSNS